MHQRIGHSQWRSRHRLGRRIIEMMACVAALTLLHTAVAGGLFAQAIILADTNQYVNKPLEVILYPFDSVESGHLQWRFSGPSSRPGRDRFNREEPDNRRGGWSRERVYDISLTAPGSVIAEHLVWGENADVQLHRLPTWIIVTAHLFSAVNGGKGAGVEPDSVVLEIDIIAEIPAGTNYRSGSTGVMTAADDTSIVHATLQIRKLDLEPSRDAPLCNYNRYRRIAIPVDIAGSNNVGFGDPFNSTGIPYRFDIRVRWTGTEKLAVRSITLRDGVRQ